MFTVLVVDSRIKRSRSLNDAFGRILGNLRDVHHLRTDLIGTTEDAIIRLRNDASVACVLLEWGGKGDAINGKRWDSRAAPMIAYLKLFEESYAHFPGFANEIQGVYPEEGEDGRMRLFTYAIRE